MSNKPTFTNINIDKVDTTTANAATVHSNSTLDNINSKTNFNSAIKGVDFKSLNKGVGKTSIKKLSRRRKDISKELNNKMSKKLDEILNEIVEATTYDNKIEKALEQKLSESDLSLHEKGVTDTPEQNINSYIFSVSGKKDEGEIEQVMREKLVNGISRITQYTSTGVYRQILEAKLNEYTEKYFPKMKIAAILMVDDIINGSMFGDEELTPAPFKYFRNGVMLTDEDEIERFNKMLNPKDLNQITSEWKSFNDVNRTAIYEARKHGYADVRVVKLRDIAIDLYVKYVLKEVKKDNKKNKNRGRSIKAVSKESVDKINIMLNELGYESITAQTDLVEHCPKVLRFIDPNLIELKDNEDPKNQEDYEYMIDETFPEFCERQLKGGSYLNSDLVKVVSHSTFLDKDKGRKTIIKHSSDINKKISTESKIKDMLSCYSNVESEYSIFLSDRSLSEDKCEELLDKILECVNHSANTKCFSFESTDIALESVNRSLNSADLTVLDQISFKEIYSSNLSKLLMKSNIRDKDIIGNESYNFISNESIDLQIKDDPLDNLFIKTLNKLNNDAPYLELGFESVLDPTNSEFNDINKIQLGYETSLLYQQYQFPTSHDNTKLNANVGNDPLGEGPNSKNLQGQERIVDVNGRRTVKNVNLGRLYKMFSSINGDDTEVLDNTRLIPLMAGNRQIGAMYIEFTHEEVQHFVNMRTLIANPVAYAQNIDVFSSMHEEAQGTLGKMTFVETIKPLLEKYMGAKFLKQNQHALSALHRLLLENQLSTSMTKAELDSQAMYNLAKVIFIPTNELVFYRNGNKGLGRSLFQEAYVPANLCILADEAQAAWTIADGKGWTFITVPRGLSEQANEFGTSSLAEQIEATTVTRSSLREMSKVDMPISRNMILLTSDEDGGVQNTLDVKQVDVGEFSIPEEWIKSKEQEATNIVGYSSASFTSTDGTVELARKLFEINGAKMLEVQEAQDLFRNPASLLATKMLKCRAGSEADNVTVLWCPPPPARSNKNLKSEITEERQKLMESYMNVLEGCVSEDDENAEEIKYFIKLEVIKAVFSGVEMLGDPEAMIDRAKERISTKFAREAEDVDSSLDDEDGEDDNNDEDDGDEE